MHERSDLRVVVRRESIDDRDAIRSLTSRAFSGLPFSDGTEPLVIDALREAAALALSLVAALGEQIVGHIAFSEAGPPGQSGWLVLGPVSVEPRFQRRGVGSQLIRAGLQTIRAQGAKGCVLLGDHRYYHRFGFVVAPAYAPAQYPARHFQVACFGDAFPNAPVAFHPAFSAVAKTAPRAEQVHRGLTGGAEPAAPTPDQIEIVEYDARWPDRFALESARIRHVLAEPALEIEHHGSTAVPGLAAKPVIDMLVAAGSMEMAERYAAALLEHGYEAVEPRYREMWPERIVLIRREHGERMCHVHLMLRGHPAWNRLLVFRDYLRTHPDVAAAYAELKRSLAAAVGRDRHAYMTAKGEFITRVTAIAMGEQGSTG